MTAHSVEHASAVGDRVARMNQARRIRARETKRLRALHDAYHQAFDELEDLKARGAAPVEITAARSRAWGLHSQYAEALALADPDLWPAPGKTGR